MSCAGAKKLLGVVLKPPATPDPAAQAFGEDIAETIAHWICTRLGDYVANFPPGEGSSTLDALVQLLGTLHQAAGHGQALPEVRLRTGCLSCQ